MIEVRTTLSSKKIAKKIAKKLVEDHCAITVHIKKVKSTYAWNSEVYNKKEYELSVLGKDFEEISGVINKYSDYELTEILCYNVESNSAIWNWYNEWCKEKGNNYD